MDLSPTANTTTDATRIGLDDDLKALSGETAAALLRLCAAPEERVYSSVQVMPIPNGSSLYVKSFA